MTQRFAWLLLAAVLVPPAAADSLFVPGRSRSMFSDRKAFAVGDVITVVITETTVALQDAKSDAQRSVDGQARGATATGLLSFLRKLPRVALGGSTTQTGSGSTARSSRLVTIISCRVVQIEPGGQLSLNGERNLRVNSDTQVVKFSGIVRPEDVAADNSVASSSVADAIIEVLGKGPIDRHVRPGFLSRIFQFLF